jgi:electron transport complex protein RnfE
MASNGISMGLATTAVLVFSNLFISSLRNIIPGNVRIPAFIVVIASFTTIVQLLIKAYLPALDQTLGIYIPLIVVNCIIFARAESFAFSNPPMLSIMDGLGMGLGFTLAITILASLREIIGKGTFFGMQILPASVPPMTIVGQAPGGFIMLGLVLTMVNLLVKKADKRKAAKTVGEEEAA